MNSSRNLLFDDSREEAVSAAVVLFVVSWLSGWLDERHRGAAQFGEEPVQGSEQAACDGEEDPVWFWGHCYSAGMYIVDRMKSEGERGGERVDKYVLAAEYPNEVISSKNALLL
jgi:hypothetical protein